MKCNIQYVGSTTRNLKCRMREHIHSIETQSNSTTVSRHFLECSNGDVANLKIQGIEKIYQSLRGGDKAVKLRYREAFWIFTLDTRQPKGLNFRFDVVCHV
ncbi:hypothetical protein XELAEV_18005486mg [Xenopus laevis]|uniref:GIY-YIG domain-containing protein n=1 Tax=Xenopus laevis TaxID=8355 RepID=A0A974DXD6_XENLA|nr:hypothetical protein XELAEV_18005486mg [Xenopus laevis]